MVVTVRFGELWLRGRNRGMYISALRKNLISMIDTKAFFLENGYDRFIIRPREGADIEKLKVALSHLFGISGYEVSYATKPNLVSINSMAKILLKKEKPKSVKINAHRSYKKFKFNSIDITRKLIKTLEGMGVEPELHDYDAELFVNVTKDAAFLYIGRTKGLGGLPVGTSGKGVVLLSGGIDSPVAAWYAMKRGVEPIYVHIHGFPKADEALKSKIPRLIRLLSAYGRPIKTYYIPSHLFQVASMKSGRHELILLKAFMLRIAELVAEKEDAEAIFTGESLGQVASQTISNLQAEQNEVRKQILRPLIGFDKEEIIAVAKKIGTYGESIKPYRDVCSINSKNPATRTDVEFMGKLFKKFKIDSVAKRSLKDAKAVG